MTRHELVDKYTRYLNGDVSMIKEMIDRQENVEESGTGKGQGKYKLSQKTLGAAIKACGGINTPRMNTYATVNNRNNLAVLGAPGKAIVSVHLGYRATRQDVCPGSGHQVLEPRTEQTPPGALPHRRL